MFLFDCFAPLWRLLLSYLVHPSEKTTWHLIQHALVFEQQKGAGFLVRLFGWVADCTLIFHLHSVCLNPHKHCPNNFTANDNNNNGNLPNLKCIALSAYKSNRYVYLDIKSQHTQTVNTCTRARTHTHTHTHARARAHLDTHTHLRAGGLKKKFSKREISMSFQV